MISNNYNQSLAISSFSRIFSLLIEYLSLLSLTFLLINHSCSISDSTPKKQFIQNRYTKVHYHVSILCKKHYSNVKTSKTNKHTPSKQALTYKQGRDYSQLNSKISNRLPSGKASQGFGHNQENSTNTNNNNSSSNPRNNPKKRKINC